MEVEKLDLETKTKLDGTIDSSVKSMELQRGYDGKQAWRNIDILSLFPFIKGDSHPDEKLVKIKFKEVENISAEFSIDPGSGGRPTLALIQHGGTISFEQRNIKGFDRSLLGFVTTTNLLNPQDDLVSNVEYVHGVSNSSTLRTSCFNSRKLSPVFTGPGVAPIWVDRAGIKANITKNLTSLWKFTYGIVMEEIITTDRSRRISTNGQRVLVDGGDIIADGPTTTLSGTGIDRMVFAQANITSDNTRLVNGQMVGYKVVSELHQGLGIGSKFPFFNRHLVSLTRFIQLKEVEKGSGKAPPPVLVLHGRYGGAVGDQPCYNAFTLGGPYSVRGYNVGEIGAATSILELAAEIRIPFKITQIYGFAEYGNDLGSSRNVMGNPNEVYGRKGWGSSYGVGAKLGLARVEYAVNHNSGTGAVFLWFGDRFC